MVEAAIPSLAAKVQPVDAGGQVVAAAFLGPLPAFALGEGEALIVGEQQRRVTLHGGALLGAASDGARLFTCGDDGRLVATGAEGATELLVETPGKWIDHLALGPDGALAWSVGKSAFVRTRRGERALALPSSVGGVAFAPKGVRLAVAHYNGVTLWFPNAPDARPETLTWKGSHLDVSFSPDGRFLVTSMQEPALHGWRLADGHHMRMTGYPARVRSMAFTADGKWLATSGAAETILWPFATKDGPMGKQPRALAAQPGRVAVVACHPRQEVIAAGYANGLVILIRLADGAALLVRQPEDAAIGALAWRSDGQALAFGTEDGKAGVLVL
jgi:WD40 repeat protein